MLMRKSLEQRLAQIEYFIDTHIQPFSTDQRSLLQNSTTISTIEDLQNLPTDLPENLKSLIKQYRAAYTKTISKAPKEELLFKKANAELYNIRFKDIITTLKQKIENTENPKLLLEYLGSGSNGSAYLIEVEGVKYAAKFSKSVAQTNFEIKPLRKARGIKHTAQLEAYSLEEGCVIMELLPGTDVTQLSYIKEPNYSDDHINQLINTVVELYANGITIDPKPSNFMYDPQTGFSVLDFHLSNNNTSIGDIIMDLRLALTARDWPKIDWNDRDAKNQDEKQRKEKNKIDLPIMVQFLTILTEEHPEIIEDYWSEYEKREADDTYSQSPLIDRNNIENDSELDPHLNALKQLGF